MLTCPPDITTKADIKRWIIETAISLKPCKCPCCGQTVKLYPRKLSSALGRFLVDIYKFTIDRTPADRWVNVSKEMIVKSDHHITRDYSILRFWGLLESAEDESSQWRITDTGIAFVEGRMVVPQKAYIYNNYCVRLSETTTDINSALGKKFDLKELLESREVE